MLHQRRLRSVSNPASQDQLRGEEMEKPDCYKCVYRRDAVGSAHSQCIHPANAKVNNDPLAQVFAILGSVGRGPGIGLRPDGIKVKGSDFGKRKGWFNWPINFDPVWLEECDGFNDVK